MLAAACGADGCAALSAVVCRYDRASGRYGAGRAVRQRAGQYGDKEHLYRAEEPQRKAETRFDSSSRLRRREYCQYRQRIAYRGIFKKYGAAEGAVAQLRIHSGGAWRR